MQTVVRVGRVGVDVLVWRGGHIPVDMVFKQGKQVAGL